MSYAYIYKRNSVFFKQLVTNMHLLVFALLVGASFALPQGYILQKSVGYGGAHKNLFSSGRPGKLGGVFGSAGAFGSDSDSSEEGFDSSDPCGEGEIRHIDGRCTIPVVTRNIFLYNPPKRHFQIPPPPKLPQPEVNYNVVLIRSPEHPKPLAPIVVPPPQQKTLVYVLGKVPEQLQREVIETPGFPAEHPEVFFVNYDEGDNPQLPIGIDLRTALASVDAVEGQVIHHGASNLDGELDSGSSESFIGHKSSATLNGHESSESFTEHESSKRLGGHINLGSFSGHRSSEKLGGHESSERHIGHESSEKLNGQVSLKHLNREKSDSDEDKFGKQSGNIY